MNKFKIKIDVDTNVESQQAFDFMFGRKNNPLTKHKMKINIELDPIFELTITEIPNYASAKEDIRAIFERFSDFEMDYIIYINDKVLEIGTNANGHIKVSMSDELLLG